MKVAIVYKKEKIGDKGVIPSLIEKFASFGIEAFVFDGNWDEGFDTALVLGGDGSIIHAAVEASRRGIKILGVNYGNFGFLAEYESRELFRAAELIGGGNYKIRSRAVIEVCLKGEKSYCLNEIAIQRNTVSKISKQMIRFSVKTDGEEIENILSDGLIVCTPTGSTAYSLSAGGCIMAPGLNALMMTPICAFSLNSRPVVFPDHEKLDISLARERDCAVLFGDGKIISEINYGDSIIVRKADFTADFITENGRGFWKKLSNKFGK